MMLRKYAVTALLVTASTLALTGTASAAPGTESASEIHYTASLDDKSVVVETDAGSLATANGQFQILDTAGNVVAGLPLTFQAAGQSWPIVAEIIGNTATLTPTQVSAIDLDRHPVDAASDAIFNQALSNFGTTVGAGVAIGGLIGTAVGAGIGCLAGGLAGGAAAAVVTIGTLAIPGAIGACIVTGAAAGAIGAVVGTIVVGVPVAIVAGIQFYNVTHPA
ncbi:hypothetical protein [Antrihabitans sp. YC2-6]|uniref:hypothetical protein n=1 Tax=Antrihabitans sp. YC2-6 TaxID=2799498 RepID=UPI001F32B54D|nr:hypothetical protein [Antrihabitans sp. YC2-6]